MQILHYVDPSGADVFQCWLDGVADTKVRIAVLRRLDRVAAV